MCMSSHKQYQIIDVFCNVHCNVNSYSNSKLNCPAGVSFPASSLKYRPVFHTGRFRSVFEASSCISFQNPEV